MSTGPNGGSRQSPTPAAEDPAELLSAGRGEPLPGRLPPVTETVAEHARTKPSEIAVSSGGVEVCRTDLDAWAGHIAARLADLGASRGDHVAVLADPSVAMVAAVLGVLKCGAAYVPIDPAQPDRRVREIVLDCRAHLAVVTGDLAPRLRDLDVAVVRAKDHRESAVGTVAAGRPAAVAGTDSAYVIYTSGSTGEPKGVVVEHRQLAASTYARRRVYPGAPVFLLVSPLAFDSSVAGLWGTLTSGGRLVVATSTEVSDPERLVRLIDRHRVTHVLCVPSLYSVLLDAAERLGVGPLRSLDSVIVAGEPLSEQLVHRHFALQPRGVALVNEYGPTEATVWASYRRFTTPGPVSIGGPIPGANLYVLDERRQPVPCGVEGELYIGGAGVARGYLHRPGATSRVFIADPLAGVAGARMYRTGDLVRWSQAGTLEFLGRRDHQVKIRGHRVELGAVEAVLRDIPAVRDAIVLPDLSRTSLVGFLLARRDAFLESIREQLAARVPAAMVPARMVILDEFPHNLSGKVDRAKLGALLEPEQARPVPSLPTGAAGDGLTAQVTAAWAEVLRVSDVPSDTNFFDLGGHSLTMFRLQDALERHSGVRPSIVDLFRHTTVSAQVALIRDGAADAPATGSRTVGDRRASALRARQRRTRQEIAH